MSKVILLKKRPDRSQILASHNFKPTKEQPQTKPKQLGWCKVENMVLDSSSLSLQAKGLYSMFKRHMNMNTFKARIGAEKLMKKAGISGPTFYKYRRELADLGLLSWTQEKAEGSKWTHCLYDFPLVMPTKEILSEIMPTLFPVLKDFGYYKNIRDKKKNRTKTTVLKDFNYLIDYIKRKDINIKWNCELKLQIEKTEKYLLNKIRETDLDRWGYTESDMRENLEFKDKRQIRLLLKKMLKEFSWYKDFIIGASVQDIALHYMTYLSKRWVDEDGMSTLKLTPGTLVSNENFNGFVEFLNNEYNREVENG